MKTLFVVGTPIGNIEDISLRAKKTLSSADVIFCEDTRVSKRLLRLLDITKKIPLISLNKYSEFSKIHSGQIDSILEQYNNFVLVSDAGMPTLSDPGMHLVNYCLKEGIAVKTVPGPCALSALISISGINMNSFTFLGFLPHTKTKKEKLFIELSYHCRHFGFYESPLRIRESISILKNLFPEATVSIGRELTKLHEELIKTTLKHLDPTVLKEKGEYSVFVELNNLNKKETSTISLKESLANYLNISKKDAFKILYELKNKKGTK